jgi:hypothetical protein
LHADDHDACGDAGVPLGGGPSLSVCPNVEDLARYLIDEDWLPEPAGGAGRIEPDTEDTDLQKAVWCGVPFGLREWCLKFEPMMWRRSDSVLVHFEEMCQRVQFKVVEPTGLLPMGYFGYKSMEWREAVVSEMVAVGMSRGDCAFVLMDNFGFGDDFGKVHYRWDAQREGMKRVLSMVDKFVSIMMGSERPAVLQWAPFTEIVQSEDWRPGGVHEPEAVENWSKLHGISSWVMQWVRERFYVEPDRRVPHTEKKNASFLEPCSADFDEVRYKFVDEKFRKEKDLGVIERMGMCKPDNVNRVSTAPKDSPTEPFRVVHAILKPNEFYRDRKVRFETIRHIPDIFERDDFVYLLDLRAAYHSVLVQERLARQFGFQWRGVYWKHKSLPFGFRLSPYCFQKMMRQVVKHCRFLRRKILQFLDDGLGGARSFVQAVIERNEMINLLHGLGFRCSAKSSPLPEQTKKFLGMIVHLAAETPTFHVPQHKIDVVRVLMSGAVEDVDGWTMRKVAKITGKLLSMSLAIPATRLMSRALYKCLYSNSKVEWDAKVMCSQEALVELQWLIRCLEPWNAQGYPIWQPTMVSDFDVTPDASPVAGGFKVAESVSKKIMQFGTLYFRPEEAEMAQCHREFWILCLLVRGLARELSGRKIRVRVDANTTVLYWRNGGGTSELLTRMVKLLWATCVRCRITIVEMVHIPGVQMVVEEVDALSRPVSAKFGTERDRAEWSLTDSAYASIESWLGVECTVDRFASRVNHRCARYCAKEWEPEALQPPSAFAHHWRQEAEGRWEFNFVFPPMHLIANCIQHAKACRAWMCIIAPRWPSQPWWPQLMDASVRMLVLGRSAETLRRLEDGKWSQIRRPPFELVAVVCDFR